MLGSKLPARWKHQNFIPGEGREPLDLQHTLAKIDRADLYSEYLVDMVEEYMRFVPIARPTLKELHLTLTGIVMIEGLEDKTKTGPNRKPGVPRYAARAWRHKNQNPQDVENWNLDAELWAKM